MGMTSRRPSTRPAPPTSPGWLASLTLAAVLALGACSDEIGQADSSTPTPDGAASTSSTDADTTTSESTTSTTEGTTTSLPGQPIEGFVADGDVLGVMGVADDDVLNVRAGPGTDQEIVATAAPTAQNLVATGRTRSLPSSIWYEVTTGGETGWVSLPFVAFVGRIDDATAEFLDGAPPIVADTMTDLGAEVAAGFASEDPPSRIRQSVAPTVGDLGEVTYDVVGLGDDAVAGFRLHVFGAPVEGGDGFVLMSVERTTFCTRGLVGDLCA